MLEKYQIYKSLTRFMLILSMTLSGCYSGKPNWQGILNTHTISDAVVVSYPIWNPAGDLIAVVSREAMESELGVIQVINLSPYSITPYTGLDYINEPHWATDENVLVYGQGCSKVVEISKGKGERVLANGCAGILDSNRQKLVVYDNKSVSIKVYDYASLELQAEWQIDDPLIERLVYSSGMSISPVSDDLVISLNTGVKSGNHLTDNDIYIINLSDGSYTKLISTSFDEDSPSWSMDGKYVVFVSTDKGSSIWKVGFVNATNKCVRYPLVSDNRITGVAWSPIDMTILAVTIRNSLYVVNLEDAVSWFTSLDSDLCLGE